MGEGEESGEIESNVTSRHFLQCLRRKTEIGFLAKPFQFFVNLIVRFFACFSMCLNVSKWTASFDGNDMDISCAHRMMFAGTYVDVVMT